LKYTADSADGPGRCVFRLAPAAVSIGPVVTRVRIAIALAAVLLVPISARAQAPQAGAGDVCEFTGGDARWVQRALDGWELVRRDALKVEPRPVPWILLYDASCQWELSPAGPPLVTGARILEARLTFAGAPLPVRATPHRGTVLLPNRLEIAIEVKASTMLYRNGRATFFVMAMPSVWRADRRHASKPFLDEYLQGVFVHELTHTLQLVPINRRLRRLIGRSDVPGQLTDDAIQTRFGGDRGFARAFERERDLFYRAALTRDASARRNLVRKALALTHQRHGAYFSGANEAYVEIEALFLTMEGAAQWAAYSLARTQSPGGPDPVPAMNLVRDDRRYWSQDLGLALFLLLDEMVPGWQERIFEPLPASPFALLGSALDTGE